MDARERSSETTAGNTSKARRLVRQLSGLNERLQRLQDSRRTSLEWLSRLLPLLNETARHTISDKLNKSTVSSTADLPIVRARWSANGKLIPAPLWSPPLVNDRVYISRDCADRRLLTTCDQKREAGLCDRTWGCRATCGQCDTYMWSRQFKPKSARRDDLSRVLNASALPVRGAADRRVPTLATPWLTESEIEGTVATLSLPGFRNMMQHNVTADKVHAWRRAAEQQGKRRSTTLLAHRHYASCAVVGSSHSLLHRRHGTRIDGAQLVIRINDPPVPAELAEHIGTRTSLLLNILKHPYASHPSTVVTQILNCVTAYCWHHLGIEGDTYVEARVRSSNHADSLHETLGALRRPLAGTSASLHSCSI